MKKISVIVLVIVSLAISGYAEAAKPKHRTRNANRVGPYGSAVVGFSTYTGDQGATEEILLGYFDPATANLGVSTDDSDVGYGATFGYRFNRYMAFELTLAQYGTLSSKATGDLDDGTGGTVPGSMELTFTVAGPVFSAIGILPIGEKFEFYGRLGMLFAASQREITQRQDGQTIGFGNLKGDSSELVLGAGFAWNFNQVYAMRIEYQKIDEIGDPARTGTEDLTQTSLAFVIRF